MKSYKPYNAMLNYDLLQNNSSWFLWCNTILKIIISHKGTPSASLIEMFQAPLILS